MTNTTPLTANEAESFRKLITQVYPSIHWEEAIDAAYADGLLDVNTYQLINEYFGRTGTLL